jgi:integrase
MASLFKLRITRYIDANGKRVSKSSPNAKAVREKSRKWYGEYTDAKGLTHRQPLSTDRAASQAMLNELVKRSDRLAAGLVDVFDEHAKRPLKEHLSEYDSFMQSKGNSASHASQTIGRIRRLVAGCEFRYLSDIDATKISSWLADQRTKVKRFSAQTSNFYLDAFKYFCNWLVTHSRLPRNPVQALRRVTIETDRRHDRRAITDEEFARLIASAETGPVIEGLRGCDRAMLYLVAAWTGYRRRELSSLTRKSLILDSETPMLCVQAAYSKRRRDDVVPLHGYVVERLKIWLQTVNSTSPDTPLFKLKTKKGYFRCTSKMMKRDLERARAAWIKEGTTEAEQEERTESDFLKYQNEDGLFADFHANRHTFISNLSRAGVTLAVAQRLARHSDPRLTSNRYTHLSIADTAAAIRTLAVPPNIGSAGSLVAVPVAGTDAVPSSLVASTGNSTVEPTLDAPTHNPNQSMGLDAICQYLTPSDKLHPDGLEPSTFGSVDRCSIQLSYGCISC